MNISNPTEKIPPISCEQVPHMFRWMKFILAAMVAATAASCPTKANAANQQALSGFTEDGFLSAMAIDGYEEVRYLNENGSLLSFADFIAAMQSGYSFSKEARADRSLAILKLKPKGNPGSDSPDPGGNTQMLNTPISSVLPPLDHMDLDGRVNLLADGEHYTLLSFFFADCVPCIQDIPALNTLATSRTDLKVVSVTFETRAIAVDFVKERGLKTAVVPEALDYIDAIGIKVYPTLLLVSPEGRLMGVRSGYKVNPQNDAGLSHLKAWMQSLGLKS